MCGKSSRERSAGRLRSLKMVSCAPENLPLQVVNIDYYGTYRLVSAYLTLMDAKLE